MLEVDFAYFYLLPHNVFHHGTWNRSLDKRTILKRPENYLRATFKDYNKNSIHKKFYFTLQALLLNIHFKNQIPNMLYFIRYKNIS
jgi:hypothetical protein